MIINLNLNTANNMTIKRGSMFWVDFGKAEEGSSKQSGKRPALIISNNTTNRNSTVVEVVPISTRINKNNHFGTHVLLEGFGLKKTSIALCEQQFPVDKKDLISYIGRVDNSSMDKVDTALKKHLGLNRKHIDTELESMVKELKYYIRSLKEFGDFNESLKSQIEAKIRFDVLKIKNKYKDVDIYNITGVNIDNVMEG